MGKVSGVPVNCGSDHEAEYMSWLHPNSVNYVVDVHFLVQAVTDVSVLYTGFITSYTIMYII